MDRAGQRDCEHGHQARKCPICELTAELTVWKLVAAKVTFMLIDTEFKAEPQATKEQRASDLLAMFVGAERKKENADG